jgi:hypothetical protein
MIDEHTIAYDSSKYDFQSIFKRIFEVTDLQSIHLAYPSLDEQLTFEKDTKTHFHRKYYDSVYYTEAIDLYNTFVRDVILPRYSDTAYAVQVDPSFRIHLPNNTALGIREEDTDDRIGIHCDAEYNHQPGEINFVLPITQMFDTNTLYVESSPLIGDFHPVTLEIGEVFCFYGNKCRHFNKCNRTEKTRISLDFRIIPMSSYDETWDRNSVHGKLPLKLGGYFKKVNGDCY